MIGHWLDHASVLHIRNGAVSGHLGWAAHFMRSYPLEVTVRRGENQADLADLGGQFLAASEW